LGAASGAGSQLLAANLSSLQQAQQAAAAAAAAAAAFQLNFGPTHHQGNNLLASSNHQFNKHLLASLSSANLLQQHQQAANASKWASARLGQTAAELKASRHSHLKQPFHHELDDEDTDNEMNIIAD